MTRLHSAACLMAALSLAALAAPAPAAERAAPPPSTAPSPAESTPLSTTTEPNPEAKPGAGTAMPAPEKSLALPRPAGAAPAGSMAAPARQTLAPSSTDAGDVEEVTLPAKPAAIVSGTTTWETAVPHLKASFRTIEEALAKAGIRATGKPIAVFTKTEESGFQYEAMIPVEAAPAANPAESAGLRFGTTPSGKALRYKHAGSYDEITGTYDTLIAYFDAKDIAVQDQFIEEYVTDLADGADERLDINIYALLK